MKKKYRERKNTMDALDVELPEPIPKVVVGELNLDIDLDVFNATNVGADEKLHFNPAATNKNHPFALHYKQSNGIDIAPDENESSFDLEQHMLENMQSEDVRYDERQQFDPAASSKNHPLTLHYKQSNGIDIAPDDNESSFDLEQHMLENMQNEDIGYDERQHFAPAASSPNHPFTTHYNKINGIVSDPAQCDRSQHFDQHMLENMRNQDDCYDNFNDYQLELQYSKHNVFSPTHTNSNTNALSHPLYNDNSIKKPISIKVQRPGTTEATDSESIKTNENISSIDSSSQGQLKREKNKRIEMYELAELISKNIHFTKIGEILYYYDEIKQIYIALNIEKFDIFLRQNITSQLKKFINSHNAKEIYRWVISMESIEINEDQLKEIQYYIRFEDCYIDLRDFNVYELSPDIPFTSYINASFDTYFKVEPNNFEMFMRSLTNKDQMLYNRIQELFGYVISEQRNLKIIPFLLGPKDCGKSIVLSILELLIGENNFSNISFDDLNNKNYLYELHDKKINTCGETSELSIRKLDNIKKLSGGDYISADRKFEHPIKFVNKAVLIFAGNHLPLVKGIDPTNAFAERLLVFPFGNPISKSNQDPYLINKIEAELDYIGNWALQGFKRLIKNNYVFSTSDTIKFVQDNYKNQAKNTIEQFINAHCIIDSTKKISSKLLYENYSDFCYNNDYVPESDRKLIEYLYKSFGVVKKKCKIDNQSLNYLFGIDIKKEVWAYEEY